MSEKVAVIGYGSWATALVRQMVHNGVRVCWLVTNPEVREGLETDGRNPKYIRDAELDMNFITLYDDINEAVADCPYVLLACPSAFLKKTLEPLSVSLEGRFVISAIKGIVPDEYVTPLEYIHDHYGLPFGELGLVSGPSHAEEVSNDCVTYVSAVASTPELAQKIKELFGSRTLKIDTSTDIYGVEYAGVLKNIYAIVCGIAAGLGYGDNFLAVLVAESTAEMKRFLSQSYPYRRHVANKAYLGDLLVTCYSNYSRNRRLGVLIGRGCSVKSALNEMTMVSEGYYSARLIQKIKEEKHIDMPIVDLACKILYEGASPRRTMASLIEKL